MELYEIFLQHPVICTDSRNCPADSLFFALKGDNFNANAYALSALEKGCAYAVIDEEQYAVDERFILVDNVLETLQNLARHHRQQLGTTIIGITGTNGKTTTKELIAAILKQKFNTLFTQGNLNNHIGVPLTLLQLTSEHEIAVVEMGANHPGEIKQLAEIALPDYGIITNVGKAHLEGFGSFEGVMKTKGELYQFINNNNGKIFLNTGNAFLITMSKKAGFLKPDRILSYELGNELKGHVAIGKVLSCNPLLHLKCRNAAGEFEIATQLIGIYNAENVLGAATIGTKLGVSNELIKKGLEEYIPQNNRSQLTVTEHNKIIADAYNANPTSMNAAIHNFTQMDVPAKTVILGDMLELGKQSGEEHQKIVDLLKDKGFSSVYLVGKSFQATKNSFNCYATVNDLIQEILKNPLKNNFILVKGSHGIHLEKILEYI